MLYLCPKSSILTNSDKSGPFGLHRSVRQGDPLSPLLFDVALEPLALGISSHPDIMGIKIGEMESRLGLYADDTLLYLSDPEVSVPPLLNFIYSFGELSGYAINWGKENWAANTRALMFWRQGQPGEAPNSSPLWSSIEAKAWLSLVYNLDIAPDPELAPEIQQALMLGMVAAKKMILLDWKSPTPPGFSKMAQRND
ncbi:hypothetical protein DPEC_G00024950 [Dallia pectoralis]|uniref:Uncharacterized protein n=1 Tax=Dallia pectoralis TaxID=75939 RepID=A0ACC2HI66_DALPE|nr:hypothetical protein DPEC_G00024950 [Dallia pectoralis]